MPEGPPPQGLGYSIDSAMGSYGESVLTETAVDPLLAGLPQPTRVLVTGARGFVGRHTLPRLLSRGHRVRGLSRSPPSPGPSERVEWWRGDVTEPGTIRGIAEGREAVLHLVGIAQGPDRAAFHRVHVEGTRNVLEEAAQAGVDRFIYVSAAGARGGGSPFFRTKYEAEREVVRSGLRHVIFRPSVIYGPGDHFTTALASLLRRLPVFPVLGVGSLRLQPVAVEDVADALAQAVERRDVEDGVYELVGPEQLKFTKIVRVVARALDLRRPVVQLPRILAAPALWLAARLGLPMPLSPEQLDMLREVTLLSRGDNALRTVFRVEPLPFRDAVVDYL